MSHKNVCRLYDIGEADGRRFLTMEYVDGEDLASLLRRIGRFPQDKAIEIARQLCAGLAAAHERGVLHRDLKPANVMIDGDGNVRITDFGIATAAADAGGIVAGTPQYMAPEQLAGKPATIKSDIYALGLVLFEIFTGRRAFDAQNDRRPEGAARDRAALTTPSSIVRDLDPAIERVILRCLERDPDRRPASALAVAAALPGGDPLAAALAAGETPSPELLVAAGRDRGAARRRRAGAGRVIVAMLAGDLRRRDRRVPPWRRSSRSTSRRPCSPIARSRFSRQFGHAIRRRYCRPASRCRPTIHAGSFKRAKQASAGMPRTRTPARRSFSGIAAARARWRRSGRRSRSARTDPPLTVDGYGARPARHDAAGFRNCMSCPSSTRRRPTRRPRPTGARRSLRQA